MAASAKQPFGKSIGIEYAADLYETALRNASFPGAKVEFYCTDAAQFSIPHEPCVFYFFNPFDTPLLSCVLHRIATGPSFPTSRWFQRKVDEQNIRAFPGAGFQVHRELDSRDQAGNRRRVSMLVRSGI